MISRDDDDGESHLCTSDQCNSLPANTGDISSMPRAPVPYRPVQCNAEQWKIGEIGIIDEICLGRVIKPLRGGGCISSIDLHAWCARMSSTPKQPRHRHDARMIDYLLPTCRYVHVTLWGHGHPAASAAGDKQRHLLHVAVRHQQQLRSPTSHQFIRARPGAI